jgi:hypothetical protein
MTTLAAAVSRAVSPIFTGYPGKYGNFLANIFAKEEEFE